MKFEVTSADFPEKNMTAANEAKFIKVRNRLQIQLMEDYVAEKSPRKASLDEKRMLAVEWAETFSAAFRKEFHRMIVANPRFAEDLQLIPEAEIDLIKQAIYKDSPNVAEAA